MPKKQHPPIPEEMPRPEKKPEIKNPGIPEAPDTADEPPVIIPDEEPLPSIPEEVPPTPEENPAG